MTQKLNNIHSLIKQYNSINAKIDLAERQLSCTEYLDDTLVIYETPEYTSEINVNEMDAVIDHLHSIQKGLLQGDITSDKYDMYDTGLKISCERLSSLDIGECNISIEKSLIEDPWEDYKTEVQKIVISGQVTWTAEQIEEENLKVNKSLAESKIARYNVISALKKLGVEIE
jgi:hypothetical protein